MDITLTRDHYVAAVSHIYNVPITYDLLIESIASNPNNGRGMDRFLCQCLRKARISDEQIAKLLRLSPHIASIRQKGEINEVIIDRYIDIIMVKK
jgi:hypothetical protein